MTNAIPQNVNWVISSSAVRVAEAASLGQLFMGVASSIGRGDISKMRANNVASNFTISFNVGKGADRSSQLGL
jgi:hypothetical protein